jgi:hypothetical protein
MGDNIKMEYSEKNIYLINKIKNSVKINILPENTILYRFSPILNETPYQCQDTGKIGLYFSNNKVIPYGMVLEYNKPGYIYSYRLCKDLILYEGKYSFRKLEFERYFTDIDDYKKNNFIKNINPLNNYNHIENNIYPINNEFGKKFWTNSKLNNKEIFIGIDSFYSSDKKYQRNIFEQNTEPEKINFYQAIKFIEKYKN